MIENYESLFDRRGGSYDQAMLKFPKARLQEFEQVIAAAALESGMHVADVPAGGGYLRNFLPHDCVWFGHEPCQSFSQHNATVSNSALLPLPWDDRSMDVAISLAGVHHLVDKQALFAELHRVVKPNGRLILSDIKEDSLAAIFLDDFVGRHNSTGHEGWYINDKTLRSLHDSQWEVTRVEDVAFQWVFDSRDAMAEFCHQLFDLKTATVTQTLLEIESYLGVVQLADGAIGMNWSLTTITAVPQA